MKKDDFSKLAKGDTIYVPFIVLEHRGNGVDAVLPCVEPEEQEPLNFLHWEIKSAEKKRRKFKGGDIVRVRCDGGHAFETSVLRDEKTDGLVELPSLLNVPLLVDREDLTLLIPYETTKHLPEWPEGMSPEMLKGFQLSFENISDTAYAKGGSND